MPDAEVRFGTPVDVEPEAGQMSLHSDLLLHGSEANVSDRRRCGLTLRHCTPDVHAWEGWNGKGVVVRGAGAWTVTGRPNVAATARSRPAGGPSLRRSRRGGLP